MMEQLFVDIQKRIAENILEIGERVDEDYGQLDDLEGNYPIAYPCVLITAPEASWRNMTSNNSMAQVGEVQLSVFLCIDCYDDTHYSSTTANKIAERQQLAGRVHQLLQGYVPQGCRQQLSRTYSRNYTRSGGIKVYEQGYSVQVLDTREAPVLDAALASEEQV